MAKRITPAAAYQRKDAPLRLLAIQAQPAIKRDIKASLKHLGSLVDVERAADLIRHALPGRVYEAVDVPHFEQVLRVPFNRIAELRLAAAHYGVRKINGSFYQRQQRVRFGKGYYVRPQDRDGAIIIDIMRGIAKDIGDRFNFDTYSDVTLARVRAAQDRLIQQLAGDVRQNVYNIVMDGARRGLTPEETVANIRDLIGLTDTQSQAVLNFQSMLYDLDPAALTRQLRNTEYDAALQDAIDSGVDLGDAAIQRMTEDYASNYLDYRANTIARTESVRATSAGLQDSYQQAIERGALPAEAIKQFWTVALDEKTCPVCLSIPDMNPNGIAIGEQFESIDGPMDAPPDPHPACRCSIDVVTDLDMVPD